MIKSMTGFGRYELFEDGKKVLIEVKSVNYRYLDINIRMPRRFNSLETVIRNTLKKYITRGKADVYINYEDSKSGALGLRYNKEMARSYLNYLKEMENDFELRTDTLMSAVALARFPEILTMEDIQEDNESLREFIDRALIGACEKFDESRIREGNALKEDLLEKLDSMFKCIDLIEERYPEIIGQYENKLRSKVGELLENNQIDESRIAAEIVIFADKLCTDEEIVRLRNHTGTMKNLLHKGGEAGRRLDFVAQEMNREANTILSKANDFRTSEIGIELKTTIEKIREQIQNIE